jgi:hypothetical protein
METVETLVSITPPAPPGDVTGAPDEGPGRRSLRSQIARLERELADALVSTFDAGLYGRPIAGLQGDSSGVASAATTGAARLLDLGELELLRDDLVERLRRARAPFAAHAELEAQRRVLLERILAEPEVYRFVKIRLPDPGAHNCGTYQVRPRFGLIGMMAGWWHVKLSSGCPLARGRGVRRGPNHSSRSRHGSDD